MNEAQREAVAEANAQVTNAGLPSYTELASALAYLRRQATFSDLPENNAAMLMAQRLVFSLPEVLR